MGLTDITSVQLIYIFYLKTEGMRGLGRENREVPAFGSVAERHFFGVYRGDPKKLPLQSYYYYYINQEG